MTYPTDAEQWIRDYGIPSGGDALWEDGGDDEHRDAWVTRGLPIVDVDGRYTTYGFADDSMILDDTGAPHPDDHPDALLADPFWFLQPRTACAVDRLNQLADHLEKTPYVVVEGNTRASFTGFSLGDLEQTGFNLSQWISLLKPEAPSVCDSVACLAGWTVLLFHKETTQTSIAWAATVEEIARPLLRLTPGEFESLCVPRYDEIFFADPVVIPPRGEYVHPSTRYRRAVIPQQAAKAIRRFLDGWPLKKLYDFR